MSKRLRFAIFARDEFTCRYCGRQPGDVTLHVDHIIPVAKGGTNDESNLITSCLECNLGKSDASISNIAPTEMDRLRLIQDAKEQEISAKLASKAIKNKMKREVRLSEFWLSRTGRKSVDHGTLRVIACYLHEFGEELVYDWVAKAALACGYSDTSMGKYISGCKRKHVKDHEN